MNKGEGVKKLCKELDVPLSRVVAFGDGDNDVENLQNVGMGIAMKNARKPCIDASVRTTTSTNDEDGVYHALIHLQDEGLLP